MPSGPGAQGVLFDLDDTLVDLKTAQLATFTQTMTAQAARWGTRALPAEDLELAGLHFAADTRGHYQRYIEGELDFIGQRLARAADALSDLGLTGTPDPDLWGDGYEVAVRARWSLFDDVPPLLKLLEERQIPWGVVTNNTAEYQRGKLAAVGLTDVRVVIGTDSAGAPKPDPAPFLAGCAGLGLDPAEVLYVGDNPAKDGAGARDAGLTSLLVLRPNSIPPALGGGEGGTSSTQLPEGVWTCTTLHEVARFVRGSKPLL